MTEDNVTEHNASNHTNMNPVDRREAVPRLGGIALRNGLVLVSERFWAAAVREPGGGIAVASGRKPRLPGSGAAVGLSPSGGAFREGVPLLRGLSRFGESLLVLALTKVRLPQAVLPLDVGQVLRALAGASAANAAVRRWAPKGALVQELGAALGTFVPALLSLKNSRITAYHGAEHKVIGGLERTLAGGLERTSAGGLERTRQGRQAEAEGTAAGAPKEHDRCGTNLVGPLLAATVASNLLLKGRRGVPRAGTSVLAGAVSLGLALEALRWATRHGDKLAARLLLAPGRAVQRFFTTSEPTPQELAVAERALAELLRLERAGG